MGNVSTRLRVLIICLAGSLAAGPLVSADDIARPDDAKIRAAVERGLRIVEKAARNYPEHRSCFSCHHQTLPMLAMATARTKGLAIDSDLLAAQAEFTRKSFEKRLADLEKGKDIGGASLTVAYGLWTLDIARSPGDAVTTAMVRFLLLNQDADGSWKRYTSRPPLEDSNFTCTSLAVYFGRKFAGEVHQQEIERAASRARDWVVKAKPASQEDLASRLGALQLLGAPSAEVEGARREVLERQREDGGWAQLADLESDAYATGLTLFTLERLHLPTDHAAYRRGVAFLLRTQGEDGSWHVKTRSKPIQTFFDNDDPHGADQFISIPATAWGTTALALALPDPRQRRF
jgi:N-acyl-D-amino-acid deacylase